MSAIPKSYIRQGTTADGGARYNVRCYERGTRQTVNPKPPALNRNPPHPDP